MINTIIFILIIFVVVCICLGCFFLECCLNLCDEEIQINENDAAISKIHEHSEHVEL